MLASGLQIGVAADLVVLGIALSSRIRLLQRERSHLEDRAAILATQAQTDALTGLANRSGLTIEATQVLRQPGPHALMLLDLDRFKPVNDVHGHAAGDLVLAEVARRLRQSVREGDVVARLGGDEFVILFGDAPTVQALHERATRLQSSLRQPIQVATGLSVQIDSSIGVALAPQDGNSLDALLKAADSAMYAAKEAGRGSFHFHQASHQALMHAS
jgi:diguanylate cyclase (GGDEF)-like protein